MTLFELDPNVVKAGWLPLVLVLALFGAIVLGYFSMRHQISKIRAPRREDPETDGTDAA